MGILILIVLIVVAGLLALGIVVSLVKSLGLVAIAIIAAAILAVGYITLFVTGMSLAGLYHLWGEANAGWAIFAALAIGLLVAGALINAIANEIRSIPTTIRCWFGKEEI